MAKLNNKAPKAAVTDTKLAKVNKKSVTIQKADKKPVKNLKVKAEKTPTGNALTKSASPKKKAAGKAKSLQKKTTPTGGASIVPKKAKKMLKAGAAKGKDLVSSEDVAKCVTVFKKAISAGLAEKKAMLDPDFKYILQLCCFKIPQCPERIARTQLKHSLIDETDDICLFVKDIEAGNKRDYQPTIDFFREKLDAAGITNIKTIMPISQITKDYKQHEMIRKLCNSYDVFLTDGRIAPHMAKKLGKTFYVHKKSPVSIRLNHPQLKEHIENAVAKVAYHQTSSGDSTAIAVAKHCMDEEKVVENIQQVLQNMRTEFPGGHANIKRAFLRPAINLSKSSVPLYVNASSGENVPVPNIEGPRAKAMAEKMKEMSKHLPEGMVMTNKGELAFVPGKRRPAEEGEDDQQPEKKKQKKQDKKGKKETASAAAAPVVADKKTKKIKQEVVAVAEPQVEAKKQSKKEKKAAETPAPEPVPEKSTKKEKKGKKQAEEVVVEAAAPVAEKKKEKKSKKTAAVEEEVPALVPVPEAEKSKKKGKGKKEAAVEQEPTVTEKPSKKVKKEKAPELDVSAADLTQEVSDLWEQIKNESGIDLGETKKPKKSGKRKAEAAPVAAAAAPAAAETKKPKKKPAKK